jgi:hypothetical protein
MVNCEVFFAIQRDHFFQVLREREWTKIVIVVREKERERERERFIPPGAKHLKDNRLSTSQKFICISVV